YRKWGILYSTGILFSGYAIFRKILNTKKNKFGQNREH
ncbi:molecular chaperone DnaJ, partial [Leptospira santarosai]|nr:molecular chaperone DnaJ [Leptospira santarosai]MDI7211411.1 molecular chaperone DnaJ [Leptospira santarosai]MDI7226805.1 molecular chaperone DnaJ [Leptospira santarosai]